MKQTHLWIVTLFPEFFAPLLNAGVIGKLLSGERGEQCPQVHLINLRDYATNRYKSVDDYPFGGGAGMILRPDILKRCLFEGILRPILRREEGEAVDCERNWTREELKRRTWVIFPSPRGPLWTSSLAKDFIQRWFPHEGREQGERRDLVFICGRYEGIDERFVQLFVDEEVSLGDYILSGGEIAVLAILDSALRYLPGALGYEKGAWEESFEDHLLESPQYTRPRVFEEVEVPEVLMSGHHARIQQYLYEERLKLTKAKRPDLLDQHLRALPPPPVSKKRKKSASCSDQKEGVL